MLRRLVDATNAHDVDAITGCFAVDYRNETPAHPARGFVGSEQVRRNWTHILAGLPDLSVSVLDSAVSEDKVWSEWEHRGTRRDGTPHLLRGVIVFTVTGEVISAGRLFLEPVDQEPVNADGAVSALVDGAGTA